MTPSLRKAIRFAKRTIEFLSAVLFAGVLWITHRGPRCVVLYYHGLKQNQCASFERQMAYLARRHTVIPASGVTAAPAAKGKPLVAVTFDDGLVSVVDHAVPILKRFGLPATICVPTGNVGARPAWKMADDCPDREDCVMNDEQVAQLDRSGFEFFSHGVFHLPLSELPDDRLRSEIMESKNRLEQVVGHEIVGISYPHGAYDDAVIQLAREAGYRVGLTTQPHLVDGKTDALEIGRTSVSGDDSLLVFKLKASGTYQGVLYLRAFKRRLVGCLQRARGQKPGTAGREPRRT